MPLPGLVLLLAASVSLLAAVSSPGAEVTPPEHRRGVEQTFLTYPEWFLVHSPAEYAVFLRSRPPSEFPYFGHVAQLWGSYAAVSEATRRYPPNVGYHVMIVVIGVSTTVEYGLKSGYETMVGRLTELTRRGRPMTEEDRYAAAVAQDYVDFIRKQPWYEYDFAARLRGLWSQTPVFGPGLLRKWERRYILTSEYGVKALYGWVIKKLTKMSYEDPLPVTAVWVDRLPDARGTEPVPPEVGVLERFPDGSALVTLPRYAAFKESALALAKRGLAFREIAGNDSVILVTVLAPRDAALPDSGGRVLFSQPILTSPPLVRTALVVPVPRLARLLVALDAMGARIEHVYDY